MTFLSYIQRLELIAFFAGYSLFYLIVSVLSESKSLKNKTNLVSLVPYSYAVIAALYFGLQLKTYYSAAITDEPFQISIIVIWGLMANLFWLPFFAKRPGLSFLHSLIFFFPVIKDVFLQILKHGMETDIVRNDMKLYTISLVIHFASFTVVSLMRTFYRILTTKQ